MKCLGFALVIVAHGLSRTLRATLLCVRATLLCVRACVVAVRACVLVPVFLHHEFWKGPVNPHDPR